MTSGSEPRRRTAPRTLLLSMPYGALERPGLGLGLLKAGTRRAGFDCDVRYLTFRFAEHIGVPAYQWFVTGAPYTAFAGDWTFAGAVNGPCREADASYVQEVLRDTWQLDDEIVRMVLRTRRWVEPFLDHCFTSIRWADYDVVGFTSTFEQNLASLALAKRIKAARPNLLTAFGGANWEGAMGRALHDTYDFVDLAFSGEADVSFPAMLDALDRGRSPGTVPGVVVRTPEGTVAAGSAARVEDLDSLPIPDFDDYFAAKEASPSADDVTPVLLLETARGCWWGAHSHCTFCGLNGENMAYRSKSGARALDELDTVTSTYGIDNVHLVDNILDMRYFRTVLPALASRDRKLSLFYEVKANLSHAQVRALALAGVTEIQPGIESLSNHILTLMRKGTTALRNVQLLKWCREFGVRPDWNLLYGFPGETAEDYADILEILIAIDHLEQPSACGPIRMDRFSPYHQDPGVFGMVNVRPLPPYRYIYPTAGERLVDIACYFDFDHGDGHLFDHHARAVIDYWHQRRAEPAGGGLWEVRSGAPSTGGLVLVDERYGHRRTLTLEGWHAAVYRGCDRAQDTAAVVALGDGAPAADVLAFVAKLESERLMLGDGGQHLSLAVHSPPRWEPTVASPRLHRMLAVVAS
jgi:ribosomal peptide maturation radical SAM protein 1